jgi:hypothetical protein
MPVSHIVTIKTEIRDLAAVRAVCKRFKWEFREGQTRYQWFGTYMGDAPLPEGVTVADLGTCTHAIHVPGCRYEIGIVAKPGGYDLRWDYWETAIKNAMGGPEAHRFQQAYAIEKAKIEARKQGHSVTEQPQKNGTIRLIITPRG